MTDIQDSWQTDDRDAFENLLQQYHRLVFEAAYLHTGNKEEAEDIFQEVFVSVWKSRHTYDPRKGKVSTWLHHITVNQCARKRRKRQPISQSLEKMEGKGLQLPETNDSKLPDQSAIYGWEHEKVMEALYQLDSKHRSVMILRYSDGLSYDEIAEILNIPLGTVKSRINQALQSLRVQLYSHQSIYQMEEG